MHYLKTALRGKKSADANLLNKLAIICGELGDWKCEEKFYLEAAITCSSSAAWFNLALAQKRRGMFNEAMESVIKALSIERDAPYMVLQAMLAETLNSNDREKYLKEAMKTFYPVSTLNDWELGWFLTAARMVGDENKITEAQAEQKRRKKVEMPVKNNQGMLPSIKEGIQRVNV